MPQRPREQIKQILSSTLRREFPHDTVDISDGFADNIHVVIVSRRFDDLEDVEAQDFLWDLIDSSELTRDEKHLISLLHPVSPALIK